MKFRATAATLTVALGSLIAGGQAPWVKLAYFLGAYETVLQLSADNAVRGAALYQLGRYEEADAAFAAVGRAATYDRAATLAAKGQYELSVAYYDAVLFADRHDLDAQANRAVVAEFVVPVIGKSDDHGRIATIIDEAGGDSSVDPNSPFGRALPTRLGVRKPVEARSIGVNQEWLDTLADAPGTYLKERLAAEHERRKALGTLNPPEKSPW